MSISAFTAATDTGRKRRRNEDAYVLAPPLFAIADGMGGAQAGEIASRLAAAALEDTDSGSLSGPERVRSLIQEANRRVHERSSADPTTSGMGTTMTVALVEGDTVAIGHVGDSRAYLLRDGRLEQLTEDHSLVNELLKSGRLSPEEAETHPQRAVITRAVGTDPDVDVDAFPVPARDGDLFVLCSDGLTDMVDDEGILDVLERNGDDIARAAKALVAEANKHGGEDNITVVAFRIEGDADAPTSATMTLPAAAPEPESEQPAPAPAPPPPPSGSRSVPAPRTQPAESRVRIAITMAVLLLVAVLLVVWGFTR